MASFCRFSAIISRTSVCSRSNAIIKTLIPKPITAAPTTPFAAIRFASVLGSLETMLPLHSTIASARLKSNIAIDTSCWSWLSQDFAIPR